MSPTVRPPAGPSGPGSSGKLRVLSARKSCVISGTCPHFPESVPSFMKWVSSCIITSNPRLPHHLAYNSVYVVPFAHYQTRWSIDFNLVLPWEHTAKAHPLGSQENELDPVGN